MLRNFITDEDLKKYHPNLNRQIWTSQSDYAEQIDEAFHIVQTDLNNKEVNVRLLMTPFDLLSSSLTSAFVTTLAATTSLTGDGVQAGDEGDRNYKRLVFNATVITGTWSLQLQGSQDNSTYEDAGASLTATSIGDQSTIFSNQYKYFRYLLNEDVAGSLSFNAYLVEDVWDRLIIYKAFELIFSDFRKQQNDTWDLLVQAYQRKYDNELSAIKYLYDADDSGAIDDGEKADNKYYLTL